MTARLREDRVLFCRIAYMREYKGLQIYNGEVHDTPKYGGEFVRENGWGGEIYNFKPYNGKCYGYASLQNEHINIKTLESRILYK